MSVLFLLSPRTQLGLGDTRDRHTPTLVPTAVNRDIVKATFGIEEVVLNPTELRGVVAISSGMNHRCVRAYSTCMLCLADDDHVCVGVVSLPACV